MLSDNNSEQDASMWGCVYGPYMIPASEGGKGPENSREVLGIECYHHYGITLHQLVEGEAPSDTVYRLVRELWFAPKGTDRDVTDENHTWENVENLDNFRFSEIVLRKNEKSPRFINILNLPSYMYSDGPGAKWFDQKYRVATVGMIAAEIANNQRKREGHLAKSLRQNVLTINGRKARLTQQQWAWDCIRLNRILTHRHPSLAYLVEGDEDRFEQARIADNTFLRELYTEKSTEQPDTHRGNIAAKRYQEWAQAHTQRNRNIARSYPHLSHLVPGEELAA